jgi:heme oxygenase
MTAHARALDLAAAVPAFALAPAEDRELERHLRSCPACAARVARMRADAEALGRLDPPVSARLHDRIREMAVTPPREGPSALGVVLVMLLLATLVIGASLGVGAFLASRPARLGDPAGPSVPPAANGAADAIRWRTQVVALAATELSIDANDLVFTGSPTAMISSDPGNLTDWTLEATWSEHGRQQRLFLYFAADQASWWIREIRVLDGATGNDPAWATFGGGPWARTPLGAAYEGNLDLDGSSPTGPVSLHLGGLRIAVAPQDPAAHPPVGGIVLREGGDPAVDGNPFDPGGPLHCSGILQLPPRAAELQLLARGYSLSWRWISETLVGSSGELILFVEDPARPMMPVVGPEPLPSSCAAATS